MENPDDAKENFYSSLRTAIRKIPPGDKLVLIGDFIARVGTDAKKWSLAIMELGSAIPTVNLC